MSTSSVYRGEAIAAVVAVIACAVLSRYIVQNPEMADMMTRGIAGPMTWPKVMLGGAAFCAVGWGISSWRAMLRQREREAAGQAPTVPDEAQAAFLPVALGLSLGVAYAFMLPWIGFPLASLAFLLLWFWVGGTRKPLTLILVSCIGIVLLLYVFVKLALMPLSRGVGVFDNFTIALFRLLGIY